jgi:iron complex transport system ATP-binding protein
MLTVSDAWFGYDERRPVLKGIGLSVAPDAIVGILGPNGSGKTTLLRLLAGTRQPQRGRVTLDGEAMDRTPRQALARRLAVVPQETQLAFDYTAGEVAMMGRYAHLGAFEIEGPRDMAIVDEALAATGTLALKDRPFATLSGGEKQRVVIAAALAQVSGGDGANGTGVTAEERRNEAERKQYGFRSSPLPRSSVCDARPVPSALPRYLLLDEPTASLDLAYQLEIAALLKHLHAERRAAIVISTHDIGLAGTLCDTLVLIRDGAVVASGATDEVLTPEILRRVYDVEAEISRHPSGQRVVVPIKRVEDGPRA